MKNSYIIILASFLLLSSTACKKVLDKTDLAHVSGDIVFKDSVLANLNLNYIYDQNLPNWGGTWGVRGDLSDESYGESKFFEGSLTINDVTDFGVKLDVNNAYGKIRVINQFLDDVKNGTIEKGPKNRLMAQALFFRAWRYFELVKLYGGVPLVLKPLQAVSAEDRDAALLPRNTTTETFQQITNDLDTAIKYLPGKWPSSDDWGRITSGAAAALKGRALLYWASPQFNPDDKPERWQAAYDANTQALDLLTSNGFGLNSSYSNMWFSEVNNPEAVFVTGFNTVTDDQPKKNNSYDNSTRPSYLGTGGGSNQPSWELVKAYPMKDGKKTDDPTSKYSYSDQLFYKNRDPRFDNTIAYNGCTWPILGDSKYRLWTYYADGKSVEQKASNTGFYLRKAIDPNVAISNVQYSGTDWMEIRFAEVLLNQAESACGINKLDKSDVAYKNIEAVRKRAGIEPGTDGLYGLKDGMTRDELFSAILYERQIEFAFEGKRFWDLRRWKLIESTLNGTTRTGVRIDLNTSAISAGDFATQRDAMDLDQIYTNYFKPFVDPVTGEGNRLLDTKYSINWKPEYYFFGIPQQALDNDPKLEQNNTWGGSFDPLK